MITAFPRYGVTSSIGATFISYDTGPLWGAGAPPIGGWPGRYGIQSTIGPTGISIDTLAPYGSASGAPPSWNMTRRSTAMHLLLMTPPAGDGAISQNERQAIAHLYAGILAGTVAAFPRRTTNMMLLLNTLPAGDGAVTQADRQDIAWHYGGILAGAAPSGPHGYIPEDFYDKSIL